MKLYRSFAAGERSCRFSFRQKAAQKLPAERAGEKAKTETERKIQCCGEQEREKIVSRQRETENDGCDDGGNRAHGVAIIRRNIRRKAQAAQTHAEIEQMGQREAQKKARDAEPWEQHDEQRHVQKGRDRVIAHAGDLFAQTLEHAVHQAVRI